ncbi:MAG: dTDP-glucose 4,6-dehydratase [Elusimicrobia bacterium]|nr:dTDP-glucose 4,6-dehydratase [Elusimicrobiota bacterium]MDE2236631.1 dTDP-glucose 4,6-dehydratase [Elusimicrobiota bacterium]MDE2426630.1 dTDP-glucose 4,6-dehydratase [Elusimicrobiota bacterium]
MRLLVTGGLGFIGSNFIRHMLSKRRGLRVVNLDARTYAGNPANLADLAGDPRYRWIRGDIADPRTVERAMAGCDAVVHCAAETHVDRSILDASVFLRTNVIGTQVLLDAALRQRVSRFVHVSTDEVYGSVPRGRSREEDRLKPNSPYAASKAASDLVARSYAVTHGAPVIVTRASNNFGPYQYPEKALPLMITNWLDGLPFPLYGDGLQVRDWLYVVDHARALELVLEKGKPGEIYNVGGSHGCDNLELVERVRGLMGIPKDLVRRVADRPGHDRRYALDCSKLRALGFRHAYAFSEALEKTVSWYRARQQWWRPLKKGGGYQAYYRKQYSPRLKAEVR